MGVMVCWQLLTRHLQAPLSPWLFGTKSGQAVGVVQKNLPEGGPDEQVCFFAFPTLITFLLLPVTSQTYLIC